MTTTIATTTTRARSSKNAAPATPANTQVTEMPRAAAGDIARLTHAAISWKACLMWQARGCPVGQDLPIWLEAETQLNAQRAPRGEQKNLNGKLVSSVRSAVYGKLASA